MDMYYFLVRVNVNYHMELYCINILDSSNKSQVIYNYPICFSSRNTNNIIKLLLIHNIINSISISHALYLGKELCKAEISFFISQKYIQE